MNKSRHLFHIAKHKFVAPDEVKIYSSETTESLYIGALPGELITRFPESERGQITKRADKIFSDFAQNISYIHPDNRMPYDFNAKLFHGYHDDLQNKLRSLFFSNDITLAYVDSGAFKHCFVINFGISGNSYALQTFKNTVNCATDFNHGALFEPQRYFAIYKNYSSGRIARPFMAHPSTKEILSDGYILTKYINSLHPIKHNRGSFRTGRDKIKSDDTNRITNTRNGIIVDTGGFVYNPESIADKILYSKWHEFAQILDGMDFCSENAFVVSRSLLKKYHEMGILFFDTKLWPNILSELKPNQIHCAKKMLRSLRRLKIKREKMEISGDYENIKHLLHQDFIRHFDFLRLNSDMPRDNNVFYPEIVCEILGTNNVPPLESVAMRCAFRSPMIFTRGKNRLHWNKYYTMDEVQECMMHHQFGIDWNDVIKDFNTENFIQKFLQKIRIK